MKNKLLIFCAVLLSFLTSSLQAQIFSTVGAGTTYNDQYTYPAPYGNWYWGARHQMFITAAELTAAGIAGGAQISSIGFNIYGFNGAASHAGWNIKVFTTTSSDPLVSGWVSTGMVAQSATTTVTGVVGWNQTNLLTPFIWNGSDNLVFETCFNNSSYTYNYSTYWTTTLTGSTVKTRWRNADSPTNCGDPSLNTTTNTRPDMRFEWISPTPCSGSPSANSIITPTYQICPNSSANLNFASNYTVGGLTYQWYASNVSAVGPYTLIPGTSPYNATPSLTTSTYFQAVITCTNSNATTTTSAGMVTVSPVITSTVPYFEGFEGVIAENKLPNCSWSASNLGLTCLTYTGSNTQGRVPRNGTKFASFYYSPAGANYFYTNGIQLNAGITYSASLWYETEYYGYNNWSDLSILYGTTQTTTGLVSIASTGGPALSNVYKQLSHTFTVATSGLYYVAVRGTAVSGSAQYLSWDDLSITIPCSLNSPSLALTSNSTTICMNDEAILTASGADTYTWNTGSNLPSINETPSSDMTYIVVGTNTLSGCTTTVTQAVQVNPLPSVFITASSLTICSGQGTNLSVLGNATTYSWSGSSSVNQVISVSPTVNTTYTVTGTNAYGCSAMASQAITVLNKPTITATSSQANDMCAGETQMLTGAGAATYQWASSTGGIYQGSAIAINPVVTTVYTVTGTDASGCSNKTTITQNVSQCLGVKENQLNASSLYPNPTSGEVTISTANANEKTISIMDVTGKVISTSVSSLKAVKINLSTLSNGIYYVKIQTSSSTEVVKVVKN